LPRKFKRSFSKLFHHLLVLTHRVFLDLVLLRFELLTERFALAKLLVNFRRHQLLYLFYQKLIDHGFLFLFGTVAERVAIFEWLCIVFSEGGELGFGLRHRQKATLIVLLMVFHCK
jgi:hypothetical protein